MNILSYPSQYTASDSRLYYKLRHLTDGYNNNRNFTVTQGKKERDTFIEEYQIKQNLKSKQKEKDQREEYLEELLHPELIYTKEKKQSWRVVKKPYDNDNKFLKQYKDVLLPNYQRNRVKFRLTSQQEAVHAKNLKASTDYIHNFNQNYGHILKQESPEYWQMVLYDIFKLVSNDKKTDVDLDGELYAYIPNKQAIKYLITYRKQISTFLIASDFFGNSVKQQGMYTGMSTQPTKKKQIKQKPSQLMLGEQLAKVDFTSMKQHELVLKIPTLKKNDFLDYIIFKIEPMPKIQHNVKLIKIQDVIPKDYRDCFESQKLNTIQSLVFKTAYNSFENMLVCAPTGAGKTNIATLTILNVIKRFKDTMDFKVVYISPMKALANQLVQKFTKKFQKLKTRQMTGDISLSQKQLASTHIIVTTPEKLDVITRKNTNLLEQLKLVILDQVHLLNDQRGWVLQSLVSRIFRSTERTQKNIRLVGLSATLPNYVDVSRFLRVDIETGLHHFDSSFRPVPLALNFIGCKEPQERNRRILNVFNQKCYEIALSHVRQYKQVLIFVHSRKETWNYCQFIQERAKQLNEQHIFQPNQKLFIKYKVQDKRLAKLSTAGLGFHHAGMVRSDRNQVENMFNNGDIKILVATATLAWGVNLPAYAVIIKGTDIYDPNISQSRDLSILDVQQMFGRAGRPQYDTKGQATLMTTFAKVSKYMGALTNTNPIESQFYQHLKEALNAEICSGTVTNQHQAFQWLKYTFYAIRVQKSPKTYGCKQSKQAVEQQMYYEQFLRKTVVDVIEQLDKIKLLRYDRKNLSVSSTDLGRITSHFYIRCQTMQHFCNALHITISNDSNKRYDYKTDLQLLTILAESKEFENIRVRQEEFDELKSMMKGWILDEQPSFGLQKTRGMPSNSGNYEEEPIIETPQKVLLLLQGYLQGLTYENYSLINDTQFIVQNGIRLLRCMFDLCGRKNQAQNVQTIMKWCKFLQNRMYKYDCPLIQFTKLSFNGYNSMRQSKKDGFFSKDYYERFADTNLTVTDACEMQTLQLAAKLGTTSSKSSVQNVVRQFCNYLPRLDIDYTIKPIAQTILKINLFVTPLFNYNPKWHLKSQIFWVFFDDEQEILHSESFAIDEHFMKTKSPFNVSFFIPYRDSKKKIYRLIVRSDRWIMDSQYDEGILINLSEHGIQMDTSPFTQLLDIEPLAKTVLKNQLFQSLYPRFNFFNPIQTQLFHTLYHTDRNVLIGAPTGSGKTIMSQLAILRMFANDPEGSCVYIAPLKSLAKQRLIDWVPRMKHLKKSVVELTGDFTPDIQSLNNASIIITTPQKWDGITRKKDLKYIQKVKLIIFDEIHLLGQDRGAVIEVIVSRMNRLSSTQKIRMIGLSTAMANGVDVAEWFGCGQYGFFNFKPSVRPVPIDIHFEGFTEKNYCPRMATMNKPAYNHIKKFSQGKPVLIFVSSRRQTRLTALDLISLSSLETKGANPYVKCSHQQLLDYIDSVGDQYLKQTLSFGIGMHHAGLSSHDRTICQQMFVNNKIQVLIATSTLAWGVNFPARLVIIKGTEFFDPKSHRYVDFPATDLLQMIGRAGRPQFDTKGVAVVYCEQTKKNFYRRYLNDPFPIESSLIEQIDDHINAQIARGQITSKQTCIDWFTWSYAFRRILKNPNYYGLNDNQNKTIKQFLIDFVDKIIDRLVEDGCVEEDEDGNNIMPTQLGFIASNYYLKHQTAKRFATKLKDDMNFKQVLELISNAQQFLQTPLRHNEDNFNKQLSDIAPYPIKDYGSPQAKTFLLFQMHIFNLPPPIRDYLTDGKLIIDASTRVVLGLLEVAVMKKYGKVVKILIYIQQLIAQGLSCNIPWFTHKNWKDFENKWKGGLAQAVQLIDKNQFKKDLTTFLKKNIQNYDQSKQKSIIECFQSLPKLRLSGKFVAYDTQQMKQMPNIQIQSGMAEAILKVQIIKQNKASARILMQKGNKVKDVTFWVIVTNKKEQLLCIKKVFLKNKATINCQIDLPDKIEKQRDIIVTLMTDCYIGLDQTLNLDLLEDN